MPIIVYVYDGTREMTLPGYGKWIKIKPGDQIIVARHIPCKTCDKCPGKAVVIDPPDINETTVCFLQRTKVNTDESEDTENYREVFPLKVAYELKFDKKKVKNEHRLLRVDSESE